MEKEELKNMIKPDTLAMLDKKQIFLDAVEDMLDADKNNNMVDCLDYKLNIQGEGMYDEYVDIIYTDGHVRRLLVTSNSNGANLKAVIEEVYR